MAMILVYLGIQQARQEQAGVNISPSQQKAIAQEVIQSQASTSTPIIVQQTQLPSQYPDYDAIKGTKSDPSIKALKITLDCPSSGCVNNKPATVDFDGIQKEYKVTGKFSRAYLYIEAAVDYNRPLTVWDDVYFTVNQFGGHLINDGNSLPIPPAETSEYLYDLRSISYYQSVGDKGELSKEKNIDIFSLLQDKATLSIHASISSDRPGRVMKEVSIYYECFENSNCSIAEMK
jgi:hypothetical protein